MILFVEISVDDEETGMIGDDEVVGITFLIILRMNVICINW